MKEKVNVYLKNTFWVYVWSFLTIPISYIIKIVYARNLSLEDFGVFFGLFGIFVFLTFFRNWGLSGAIIFYVNKYIVQEEYGYIKMLFWCNQAVQFILSMIIGAILFFLRQPIFDILYPDVKNIEIIFNLFIVYWIFLSVFEINATFLTIFQNQKIKGFLNFFNNGLILGSSIILVSSSLSGFIIPPLTYIIGISISALTSMILLNYFYREYLVFPSMKFSKILLQDVFKYASSLVVVGVASTLFFATDKIIVQYLKGAESVAVYVAALSIAGFMLLLISPFRDVIHPVIANLWHRGEKEKIEKLISFLYNYIAVIFLPIMIGLIIFSDKLIIAIYGVDYLSGHMIVNVLVFAIFISIFANFSEVSLQSIGRPKVLSKISIQTGILNLVLNICFIYYFGLIGVAISTALSGVVKMVILVYNLNRYIPLRFDFRIIIKIFVSGSIFWIISSNISDLVYYSYFQNELGNILANGLVVLGVSLIVYIGIIWLLGIISMDKVKQAKNLMMVNKK